MKSLLVLALSTPTALIAAAEVAGAPMGTCPPHPCPCPQAFQGFYFGGSFGYGTGTLTKSFQALGIQLKNKLSAQGFDGGLLLGYNYVFCNKLGLGLEAYFNWASTSGSMSIIQGNSPVRFASKLKNAIQVRVPFSYVICNFVAPKVVVGWDNSAWSSNITNSVYLNSRYNGFLWGCGVDFLLAKHIISGLEYTGVVSQRKDSQRMLTVHPVYNTFKATLKFIY